MPSRFNANVTVIDKCKDISNLRLDELMSSFVAFYQTYEVNKKEKTFALLSGRESTEEISDKEDLALLIQNFQILLKKKGRRIGNKQTCRQTSSKQGDQKYRIQCHEFGGFSYIYVECANTLKKKHKAMKTA